MLRISLAVAAAFLATAVSVLAVNAVLAVAIGCALYGIRSIYVRWIRPSTEIPDLQMP